MSLKKQLRPYVGKKAARRISSAVPWMGAVAAFAVGSALGERGIRAIVETVRDNRSFPPEERKQDERRFDTVPA